MDTPTFDTWGFVELFGHRQLAGKLTEEQIAGSTFLRIDVPEEDDRPAFTRMYGAGAIYSISPCAEETARAALRHLRPDPLPYYIPELVPQVAAIGPGDPDEDEDREEWDEQGKDDPPAFGI